MLSKARIAVLVSGGGTNLEALLQAQESGKIPHGEIVVVLSSTAGAYALERAKNHGVPGFAVPRKALSQADFEAALLEKLREYQADHTAVVGRVDTDIGSHDCFLDLFDQRLLPGRDLDHSRFGNRNVAHLLNRRRASVIVHLNFIQDMRIGASGPDRGEISGQMVAGFLHFAVELL